MNKRFSKPKHIFSRIKDRFGEKMEKYPVHRIENPKTDFEELELFRQKARQNDLRYSHVFRFFTSIGILLFIYFLMRLTGEDILKHFY